MRIVLIFLMVRSTLVGQVPTLDNTFGIDGVWSSPAPNGDQVKTKDIVTDYSGNIIMLGRHTTYIDLIRLDNDGIADPIFGEEGMSTTHTSDIVSESIENLTYGRLAVNPDNSIIAALTYEGFSSYWTWGYVLKFTNTGTLDDSFGDGGVVAMPYNILKSTLSCFIDIQNDGKIVVAGTKYISETETDLYIGRLNADGSTDNTFAGDGFYEFSYGFEDNMADVKVDEAGNVFACYSTDLDYINVIKFKSDGTIDDAYGSDGIYSEEIDEDGYSLSEMEMILSPTSKIYISGQFSSAGFNRDFQWSVTSGGEHDKFFGAGADQHFGGWLHYDHASLFEQNDGKLVVCAGTIATTAELGGRSIYIFRFNSDGSFDNSFGDEGIYFSSTDLPEYFWLEGAINDNLGRILVGGSYTYYPAVGGSSWLFQIYRYSNDDIAAVQEYAENNPLKIYPNPATRFTTINLNSIAGVAEGKAEIKINSILGEVIYDEEIFINQDIVIQLDVSNFTTGTYFITVNLDRQTYSGTFVKI